jgi:arginyl-tRNA synthetase
MLANFSSPLFMDIWFHPSEVFDHELRSAAAHQLPSDNYFSPEIKVAPPAFGDFQANGVLSYAKRYGCNPREIAQKLVKSLQQSEAFKLGWFNCEIAGPGFINFKLTTTFLLGWLKKYTTESKLKTAAATFYQGERIVIDYPSPNTAKQMHIGHLRPIVIGEAIQRLLRFCGANVIRDNHIGDWGTNFGILIMAIKRKGYDLDNPQTDSDSLEDLEALYKEGVALTKESFEHLQDAREQLVKLQQGDPENTALWDKINAISKKEFDQIYEQLGLSFEAQLGESFYRDKVKRVYDELKQINLAEESQGALVVFHPDHPRFSKDAEKPQPFIVRKSNGASTYASIDLATILYRLEHFNADKIIYITDKRQQDHFEQLFLTTKKWFNKTHRLLPKLEHIWFGTILGNDGKAIKTKSGAPIKLKTLLNEAIDRAYRIVSEKSTELSEQERRNIARIVGIGAVRYADLMQNRTGDYVFSWDKLLSFEGNTGPYLLYTIARIYSIFRKADLKAGQGEEQATHLETPVEITLARKLLGFVPIIDQTINELRPHYLCTYLYELAGSFNTFYNANKIIVDDSKTRARRLLLCARTLSFLETSLHLLGLETLERM